MILPPMIEITKTSLEKDGPIWAATLSNAHLQAEVISLGATTTKLSFQDRPVILSLPSLEAYLDNPAYFGVIAGRVANRTAFGRFELDGQSYQLDCNNGPHHLHGGSDGLWQRNWQMDADGDALVLSYQSPDGEAGYPAAADITLRIRLDGASIHYDFEAELSARGPMNLAQHNYYALGGSSLDYQMWIDGPGHCPVDDTLIPTGAVTPQAEGFDFRNLTAIRNSAPDGLDHNFALSDAQGPKLRIQGSHSGLEILTDQEGVQVYTAGGIPAPFEKFSAICLEPQAFPNALNEPNFNSPIYSPEKPYRQATELRFFKPDEA